MQTEPESSSEAVQSQVCRAIIPRLKVVDKVAQNTDVGMGLRLKINLVPH